MSALGRWWRVKNGLPPDHRFSDEYKQIMFSLIGIAACVIVIAIFALRAG